MRYCLIRTAPNVPKHPDEPLIVFFHSMGGNADRFEGNGYADALRKLQLKASKEANPLPAATILTFDTSANSFFSDEGGRTKGPAAYESWIVRELLPYVSKKHGLCTHRSCRGALGVSMGGFGALKLSLKYPELFSFVATFAPAIVPYNAHDDLNLWKDYFARHPIGSEGMFLLFVAKRVFPNAKNFEANDPLSLLKSLPREPEEQSVPSIHIEVGDRDDFGFQEGFELFTRELRLQKIPHVAKLLSGVDHYQTPETLPEHISFVLKGITQRAP